MLSVFVLTALALLVVAADRLCGVPVRASGPAVVGVLAVFVPVFAGWPVAAALPGVPVLALGLVRCALLLVLGLPASSSPARPRAAGGVLPGPAGVAGALGGRRAEGGRSSSSGASGDQPPPDEPGSGPRVDRPAPTAAAAMSPLAAKKARQAAAAAALAERAGSSGERSAALAALARLTGRAER